MLYCPQCQRLVPPGTVYCGDCGEALRPALENDPVLLMVADAPHADMIAPLLDTLHVPYAREGDMGVGFTMRAGSLLETYRFYIPYGAYAAAHDLIASTFGQDEEIMKGLQ